MSDNTIDLDELNPNDLDSSPSELRKAAERGIRAAKENEALKRELAFTKAGINVDDPRAKYFVKGYDGELDPEEVARAAAEAGILTPPQTDPTPPPPPVDFSAQQRVMAAAAGGQAEDITFASAKARMEEALNAGGLDGLIEVARSMGVRIAQQ